MSSRPLFAPRSLGLILSLFLLVLMIGIFKFLVPRSPISPTPQSQTPIPSPTFIVPTTSPTPAFTPLATPSATPTPAINPQTGWQIYQNPRYGISFEFPPTWNRSEFSGVNEPIVLVGTGQNRDLVAFTLSLSDQVGSESFNTASGSAWTYQGWQGHLLQTKESGVNLTVITADYIAKNGRSYRATWIRSLDKGNPYTINKFLNPILKTFRFL
jgi:hypothetical protein